MLFKTFACDLRALSRINGNKYAFMIMILLSEEVKRNMHSVWCTRSLLLLNEHKIKYDIIPVCCEMIQQRSTLTCLLRF